MLNKSQPWLDCFFCGKEKTVQFISINTQAGTGTMKCEHCGAQSGTGPYESVLLGWQNINVTQRVIKIISTMDLPK